MNRRDFLDVAVGGFGASLGVPLLDFAQTPGVSPQATNPLSGNDTFQLTSKYSDESSRAMFTSGAQAASLPPLMYLYFDRKTNRFVNPLELVPDKPQGKYELNLDLLSFNMSQSTKETLGNVDQKKDLQLTLQVAAPQSGDDSETLSWVFMNAIDIFGNKANVQDRLTKFVNNNKPTASLKAVSKIAIPEGSVELQVVALGQKKTGFWKNFFAVVTKLSASPIFASLGLPALAPEALQFVNASLNVLEKNNEKLVPIWQTQRLPFGILKDTDADYKLKDGYWITVDRTYALDTKMLSDHKLDFDGQTFFLVRADNNPVDANYLVSHLKLSVSK